MTVLLKVLKIIGKAILWILAVILLLLIIVLVSPVFYEIKGEKYDKAAFLAKVKVLFGLISINVEYNGDELKALIKIFGKIINFANEKNTEKYSSNEVNLEKEISEKNIVHSQHDSSEINSKKPERKTAVPDGKRSAAPYTAKTISAEKSEMKQEIRKVKFDDIKEPDGLLESSEVKIKRVKMAEDKAEEQKETDENDETQKIDLNYFRKMPKEERKKIFRAVLRLIKSVLRGVKPKDFYAKGVVGFDDPALTGQVVGALWALNGILDKRIEAKASFDKVIMEGEACVKGYIVPAAMLFYILRFLAVKPVRKIIILLIKGD